MLTLSIGQLEGWLIQFFWPFVRIGACLMVAPVLGAKFVPPRVRLIIAAAVTLIVAPLLPPPEVRALSGEGVVITVHQLLIGAATGFVLQLIFDALAMGGQLLSNTMGLGFAFNVDPLRGAGTPVLGQFYMLLITLTFLALNGHLLLIELVAGSFNSFPISTQGLSPQALWQVSAWGGQLFSNALLVALPGLTALLVVNLAFGVMSRAAPSLNLFAVGFPATLACGLGIIYVGLPSVQTTFIASLEAAFELIRSLLQIPT